MGLVAIAACGLALGCGGSAARDSVISPPMAPQARPGAPRITLDAILARQSDRILNMRWADDASLSLTLLKAGENAQQTWRVGLGGASQRLPAEEGTASPDGAARLVFSSTGMTLRMGQRVVEIPAANDPREFHRFQTPVWSPDGRYVAFSEVHWLEGTPQRTPSIVDGVSVIDLESSIRPTLGYGRITIIDRRAPQSPRRLILDDEISDLAWGDDDALYVTRFMISDSDPRTQLVELHARSDDMRTIYTSPGRLNSFDPVPSPDGRWIAGALDLDNRRYDEFTSIAVIDAETGQERRLTNDLPAARPIWSRDGREIYAIVRAGGLQQIWSIPLEGEPHQLTSGARRHHSALLSPDGLRLAYQTEDGYGRKDVRVLDLASGTETVVYVVDEPARDFAFGEWRHVRWRSTDGVRPYGFLFLPPDFNPSQQYPMLVDIHGGGPGSYLYLMAPFTIAVTPGPLEWHAWAALGYVVFVPDYRSTGDYGPQPLRRRVATGVYDAIDDSEDAVTGVRHMIAQGFIDPERIAVMGHSAGGPRAYSAAVHNPNLFAALIINEGVPPDPTSTTIMSLSGAFVGGNTMPSLEWFFAGRMAERPERYEVNTMFAAARMGVPTLIMMGNEARGGINSQPWEVIYSILRSQDVPTRMLIFSDEGHGHETAASAKFAFEQARDWLGVHMPAPSSSEDAS